jgi:hypothetical protein
VEAGLAATQRVHEVRYEQLVSAPVAVASALAGAIEAPPEALAAALSLARDDSVGRFRRQLTPKQLGEVEEEAGDLLAALGYLQ